MAVFNIKAILLPTERADPGAYWLGLGVIALIDAVRLSVSGGTGLAPWVLILFLVTSLHLNRLRDAKREPSLVLRPLLAGVAAKAIVGAVAFVFGMLPFVDAFMRAQGLDPNNAADVQRINTDPVLREAINVFALENPDLVNGAFKAAAWPSMWAFWLAVGLMGRWFARMPRAA